MFAQWAWYAVLASVFGGLIVAGLIDVYLDVTGRPTITQFLQRNPGWYLVPVYLLQGWLALLSIHLFVVNGPAKP
jgi:hypothetical protein